MPEFAKDEYKVENFGVPPRRGNLYVRFDIKFPVNLSEESK
jgi:DnaJ-class molecular chaperone